MSIQFAENKSDTKPSVAELASFASKAKEIDIGGGDDIVELGDDLGVNLMANPNKVSPSPKGMARPTGNEMPQIQIRPVDDLDVVNLEAAPGANNIKINREPDVPFVINTGAHDDTRVETSAMTPEQENVEKQKYLTKLRRLEASDSRGMRMSMSNSLADIKAEHERLTDSRNLEASIRFQRNALMTFVTGVEMVNDKFGHRLPVKPRLKGWSESVHTNVEDFDEIFEELYDMYKDSAKMHPMLRLVGTLGVSATMYHLTNSMAERSGIPGMADLLNENPELQRQFAAAAAAKMGGGLGNFMNVASGFSRPQPVGFSMESQPPPRVPFNVAAAAFAEPVATEPPPIRARREMRGPTGVEDVLKAFEAERAAEANAPIATQHSTVFTPSGPPPTPPRSHRQGVGTELDPLVEFALGSGASETQSVGTENTERRRGRRRNVVAPVGSTLNLNV